MSAKADAQALSQLIAELLDQLGSLEPNVVAYALVINLVSVLRDQPAVVRMQGVEILAGLLGVTTGPPERHRGGPRVRRFRS